MTPETLNWIVSYLIYPACYISTVWLMIMYVKLSIENAVPQLNKTKPMRSREQIKQSWLEMTEDQYWLLRGTVAMQRGRSRVIEESLRMIDAQWERAQAYQKGKAGIDSGKVQ